MREKIRSLAVRAYRAVNADGVARVDFLCKDGELYVNEINTVPGSLSAYFYQSGTDVIRTLLDRAVKEHAARKRLKYVYKAFGGEKGKGK